MTQLLLMVNLLAENSLQFKLLSSLKIMGLGVLAVAIVIGLLVGTISLIMFVDKSIAKRKEAQKNEDSNKTE